MSSLKTITKYLMYLLGNLEISVEMLKGIRCMLKDIAL